MYIYIMNHYFIQYIQIYYILQRKYITNKIRKILDIKLLGNMNW